MNIQDISKDLLASVTSIIEKKTVKEIDEPTAKGEKDFKDLHTKNVKVHTEKKKNECASEKDFKPHMMYDPKTGKGYEAKTYDDHVRMDKMGYTHEKPEVKEVDEPTAKGEKDFKDLHTKNVKVHTESIDEGADKDVKGDKEAYQKFFQGMLKKFGVKSPAELPADKEKEFYDAIDAGWKADNEKKESTQEEENSLDEGMKMVNKRTGEDVTKHVNDFLSGKITQQEFEKLAGLKPKDRVAKKEEVVKEMKEPFIVVDTADDNKVVGTASNEKGAERIISSAERPPISIKDKKTLKIVKSNKKQNVGFPLKEETLDEAKGLLKVKTHTPAAAQRLFKKLKNKFFAGSGEVKGDEVTYPNEPHIKRYIRQQPEVADMNEETLDEMKSATGYEIYHKDFSSAMKHAYDFAKKKWGYEIDPEEIDFHVATGPKKPSSGKTNSYRLQALKKDPKKRKAGAIHVQVYNTGKSYELNLYKESKVESGETLSEESNEKNLKEDVLKESTEIYVGKGYKVVRYANKANSVGVYIERSKTSQNLFLENIEDFEFAADLFKKIGSKVKSVIKNLKDKNVQEPITEEVEPVKEETLEERVKSMDPKKRLKIFNELKKGDKIGIAYDTPMAKADIYKDGKLVYREFTVARNKTVVGKARVEKITLAKDNVKSGVKFFLYNRDGKVSMAIGDLAAVIVDMKKM